MTNKTMVEDLKPILETPCGPLHMRPKATLLKFVYLDFIKYLFPRTLGPRQNGKKTGYVRVKPRRKKYRKMRKS
jgi:hypothetical protein